MKGGVTAADDIYGARKLGLCGASPVVLHLHNPVLCSNGRVLVTDFCRAHDVRTGAAGRHQTSRNVPLAHRRYFPHYPLLDLGRIEVHDMTGKNEMNLPT